MAINDMFQELKGFDVNELDFENIGSWPLLVKVLVWVLVFVAGIALGYFYDIADLRQELQREQQQEQTLKKEFEKKAFQAANLDAYRKQMLEMEESFGALISQLPSDTEVPGLLEDITNKGVDNGLEISQIKLEAERATEFYIELPINIEVQGSYHDFGAFVSGVAGLPRIVTLHDFDIKKGKDDRLLRMTIQAKTYRYKDLEGGK